MEWKERLQIIALMLVVFGAMFFILDHFLVWKFHLQVLAQPCTIAESVCKDVAPSLSECFKQKSVNYSEQIINGKSVGVNFGNITLNLSGLS